MNASPAADTAPPLLVIDSGVVLWKAGKERKVVLTKFFISPGVTCLERGEVLCRVFFQKPTGRWGSSFLKLGKRKGMAISVASAAAFIRLDENGIIQQARVALGRLPQRQSEVYPLKNDFLEKPFRTS